MGLFEGAIDVIANSPDKGHDNCGAILLDHSLLDVIYRADILELWKTALKDVTEFWVDKLGKVSADYFVASVAQHLAPGIVDLEEVAVDIKRLITQRSELKEPFEPLLAFLQFLLGSLMFGNIKNVVY